MRWGVAGGDGSLAVVAAAAAVHDLPFVCVQAGTCNHFAVDVGVNRHDAPGAIEAFTSGVKRRIDVAECTADCTSTATRSAGRATATQRCAPCWRPPKRALPQRAGVPAVPGRRRRARAPSARRRARAQHNNSYALDRPPPRGTRPALDTGQLGIVVLDVPGDSAPFPGPGLGRAGPGGQCPQVGARGFAGEAVPLSPPLRFVIRPARLRVRISARHPGASPAARFPLSRA